MHPISNAPVVIDGGIMKVCALSLMQVLPLIME